MILTCGDSALDLDKINDYRPDGKDVYCRFEPATHKPETIPEKDLGKFARSEDNGAIYFADMAFKMLLDLSIRAGLENARYIKAEAARAGVRGEDGDYVLKRPCAKGPLGSMLAQHGIRNALMPDDSMIVPHNLKALAEYDMITAMTARSRFRGVSYAEACLDMISYLAEYIFLGKATKSLMHIHKAVTDLLCSMPIADAIAFIDGFYARADRIPDAAPETVTVERHIPDKDIRAEIGGEPVSQDDEPEADDTGSAIEPSPEQQAQAPDNGASAVPDIMFAKGIRKISGAEITGLDDTYAAGYCEAFYDKDLAEADSEGFLEKIIMARANEGAAPIDLLAEAIMREHADDNPASRLCQQMQDIRADIGDALDGEPAGLPGGSGASAKEAG